MKDSVQATDSLFYLSFFQSLKMLKSNYLSDYSKELLNHSVGCRDGILNLRYPKKNEEYFSNLAKFIMNRTR